MCLNSRAHSVRNYPSSFSFYHLTIMWIPSKTEVVIMPNGNGTHGYANVENFDSRREVKERPSKAEFKQKATLKRNNK
ncbi:hypothetical protein BCI9360_02965 [Bacillus sp. CECT 9360]|nr:hypothetical protein BCI9360_02965 [Bacillus sp. CECT 9360]